MKKYLTTIVTLTTLGIALGCRGSEPTPPSPEPTLITIQQVKINGNTWANNSTVFDISPATYPSIEIVFGAAVDITQWNRSLFSFSGELAQNYEIAQGADPKTVIVTLTAIPKALTKYTFSIAQGEQLGGLVYPNFTAQFVTGADPTPKMPLISDEELLTLVQRRTFKYFWDYAHPISGMARERLGSGETVTTGGTGFGLMAMLVAIERGFITREQGLERLNTIVEFLRTKADKFHGAFPHWLNGTTGTTIPFSAKDNGADLVETSFLMAGLLAVQTYFSGGSAAEQSMCNAIQQLWEGVEWNWFRKNGESRLYWHWSAEYGWDMNMPVTGWNECLITYVLAAASPTHAIDKTVYTEGWARNGAIRNGTAYYNIALPLGTHWGGPLFFSHYSFLGLDPRNLTDQYAHYGEQNTAHAKINYNYCVANPKAYVGYGSQCWGLSASDISGGYAASSPTNDLGTIAPTAALASMPYTPEESMRALRFFYYTLGDRLWGEYGFKDAFNLTQQWFATSYLAIDQGPVIVMIENHRSAFLWTLFMQRQDIRNGLEKLGFTY